LFGSINGVILGRFSGVSLGTLLGIASSRELNSAVNSVSAAFSLSDNAWNGEPVEGSRRALAMSARLAAILSLDEANGIGSFSGNHDTVSQILVALVSQSQIR
jgi:hypothetical protein